MVDYYEKIKKLNEIKKAMKNGDYFSKSNNLKDSISGKYYIFNGENNNDNLIIKDGDIIETKKYQIKKGLEYNYFNPKYDLDLIDENSKKYYKDFKSNYDNLKYFNKINFGPLGLDHKGQVAFFEDNSKDLIFEFNSLEPIPEFGSPLIYKELILLSHAQELNNLVNKIFFEQLSNQTKNNIETILSEQYGTSNEKEKFDNFITSLENVNYNDDILYTFSKIKKLLEGYFYGINNNVYVYHFKKVDESNYIPVNVFLEEKDGIYLMKHDGGNYFENYNYNDILKKIQFSIKGFENKKKNDFCFIAKYHSFSDIKDVL